MAWGSSDTFEADLKHHGRLHTAYGTEFLDGVFTDDLIDACNFSVGEAGVRFGERHQLTLSGRAVRIVIPDRKGVVGIERSTAAVATLGVDQYGVDRIWIDLPFPPCTDVFSTTDAIVRLFRLEHHAFHAALARSSAQCRQRLPVSSGNQRRQYQRRRRC